MQEFFLKHKKRIIGAGIAILVLVTVIASGIKLNATLLESAIGVVVTPFQDLTTGISSWIDDTVTSARNKTKLKDENKELKQQIAELTNKNRKLSMYETENERLTALLKIAQKYPTYDSVGARVIAKDPGIWYDGFTINKGTTSSISANMVLIAPEGLVGKVLESGATFSKAQSILDSRSSVPAMSVRTGDLGVVKGNYSLANHGLCKMEYIDGDAEIMVGDEIVTSQLSDIYPEGLAIGKVLEIETDTNGLTKYAVIEPYVDLKHLDTVLVLDKGAKHSGKPINVYTILGDGEVEEGECWEAFMFAAHYKLSNLCVMLDRNHLQIDGTTETVMNSAPLEEKLKAFNFNVLTINGHDYDQIESAIKAFHAENDKPTCIILDTVKGTGVSFMTNSVDWHGKGPNDEEYAVAMQELNAAYAALEQEDK